MIVERPGGHVTVQQGIRVSIIDRNHPHGIISELRKDMQEGFNLMHEQIPVYCFIEADRTALFSPGEDEKLQAAQFFLK